MSDVVVVAQFAEGIPAAFRRAIVTNRRPTVSTFSHRSLVARHSFVAVTGYVFDLTEWAHSRHLYQLLHFCEQVSNAITRSFVLFTLSRGELDLLKSLPSSALISNDLFLIFMRSATTFSRREGRHGKENGKHGRECRPLKTRTVHSRSQETKPSAGSVRLSATIGGMVGGVNRVSNVFFCSVRI